MAKKKQIKVTLAKSTIGRPYKQKRNVEALGLRRLNHTVVHNDTPQIRGMVNKIKHLVTIEEL